MTPLITERLVIRNWEDRDRDLFHLINSDDNVMEFFPFRRDRAACDRFMDELHQQIERQGYGFTALELRASGECVGFAGLNPDNVVAGLPADTIEIGWRLAPQYWGKGYVTEAAEALLEYGFETLGLDQIVSYAVWNNERSTAVMRRIGMTAEPELDFDHPRVPDTHPELKRHVFYRMTHADWRNRNRAAR